MYIKEITLMGQTLEILTVINKNIWKSFHKFTCHLNFYYGTSKISFVEEFSIISPIEILSVFIKSRWYTYVNSFDILNTRYVGTFIINFIETFHTLPPHPSCTSTSSWNSEIGQFQYWSKISRQHLIYIYILIIYT